LAEKTIENFLARAIRLYEQEREESFGSARLALYVRRWERWAWVGLGDMKVFQRSRNDATRSISPHADDILLLVAATE
jgi:hypothetical protein